eukprot:scaffold72053_cov63-Phaeocystis_antarctica.AAC.4
MPASCSLRSSLVSRGRSVTLVRRDAPRCSRRHMTARLTSTGKCCRNIRLALAGPMSLSPKGSQRLQRSVRNSVRGVRPLQSVTSMFAFMSRSRRTMPIWVPRTA